jgi:peptidyl-prolyl cis-trans isomerase A (cyclophilin A)
MLKRLVLLPLLAFTFSSFAANEPARPQVALQTSLGEIVVELLEEQAPITTANFLKYVDAKFYDGLIFHRVIDGFVVQAGGFDATMAERQPGAPIKNEADNGVRNTRGSLSMARTSDPNSADSQFFINLVDNSSLDRRPGNPGYAVFARVVKGMEVVDAIAKVETHSTGGMDDVPVKPVVIERAQRLP